IEEIDAVELHSFDDGIHFRPIAAFRKIGDTFDQRGHTRRISVTRTSCNFGALCVLCGCDQVESARGTAAGDENLRQPSPHNASTYRPIVVGRSARMPPTSEKLSTGRPQTARRIWAASAELGESDIRHACTH